MTGAPTPNGADAAADPANGILWPVGARLVSATRSMLWLAPLLGGLMLLVHFWRVGYLPALSFSELGVVLGAFGLFVAIGLVAALVLVLFPVWSVLQWTASSILPAPPKSRPDAVVRRRRSLSRRPLSVVEPDASPAKRRTFSVRLAPGSIGLFWSTSMLAAGLTSIAFFVLPSHLASQWHVVPFAILFFSPDLSLHSAWMSGRRCGCLIGACAASAGRSCSSCCCCRCICACGQRGWCC